MRRVATYPGRDILQSGWLLGEESIANTAAIVDVAKGEGAVVMIGFRPQHRAQTHGTYKFFFNALMERPQETIAAQKAVERQSVDQASLTAPSVTHVVAAVAEHLGTDTETVAERSTENARRFYGLTK